MQLSAAETAQLATQLDRRVARLTQLLRANVRSESSVAALLTLRAARRRGPAADHRPRRRRAGGAADDDRASCGGSRATGWWSGRRIRSTPALPRIALTDAGRDELATVRAQRAAVLQQRLDRLDDGARAALAAAMNPSTTSSPSDRLTSASPPASSTSRAPSGPSPSRASSPSWASAWSTRSCRRSRRELHASPSDVSLLFTSYFAMTGVSMLSPASSEPRIGPRRTLLVGLALVVIFAALAGAAGSVFEIACFRAGLGPGQRAVHRDRAVGDRGRRVRRAGAARSSCTRPRSASASRPGRCSAGCSAGSPGAARSSVPRC